MRPWPTSEGAERPSSRSCEAAIVQVHEHPESLLAIIGAHVLLHSPEADRLREVLKDVFGWPHVEAHPGWLIFAMPPAELAVHPAEEPHHELSLMCDDLDATLTELREKGVEVRGEPEHRRFGRAVVLVLPGEVEVLLYQPEHKTAI